MDNLDALDLAASQFADILGHVAPDQWDAPTPNEGQSVRQLVDHVIGGDRMAVAILAGGSREDGIAQFARSADDVDPIAAFDEARAELAEAFATPGVLDMIVNHPAMPMPGSQLLGFRLTEYALHGWDLATAIGDEADIHPDVAEAVWTVLEPMLPLMAASGMFGEGPSGTLGPEASARDRIIDASGRRPA